MLENLLQNIFFKTIIIPIILTLGSTGLESISALVKGSARGDYKYKLWIKEKRNGSENEVWPLPNQSIDNIAAGKIPDIVEIEPMFSFDLSEYGSLAINLIMGAFTVDITSLIDKQGSPVNVGGLLVIHVLLLIGILGALTWRYNASPNEIKRKRNSVLLAITLGFLAMFSAFLATSGT